MRPTEPTAIRPNSQPAPHDSALLEQARLALLDLQLTERALLDAGDVSYVTWSAWRGHRRSVEDLAAMIRFERAV